MDETQILIAIEIAFQWQSSDRWSESYWLSKEHRNKTQIGWEKSRLARSLEQLRYSRDDIEHIEQSSISAFQVATVAESTIERRHCQLNELRGLLRQFAPELMPLVPVVNFWNDRPADLTSFVEQMIEIESKLRVKLLSTKQGKATEISSALDGSVINSESTAQEPGWTKEKADKAMKTMIVDLDGIDAVIGWSQREWADKLGCPKSTVGNTDTWKMIQQEKRERRDAFRGRSREDSLDEVSSLDVEFK